MKKNIILLLLVGLFAGCTKQKIKLEKKLEAVEHLNKYTASFAEEKNHVLLAVKALTPEDSLYIFHCNVNRCDIQPIQITVRNLSSASVLLNPAEIGLSILSPKKVAQRCHWKTKEFVAGSGIIAAVFYWPLLLPIAYGGFSMQSRNRKISKAIISQHVIHAWDIIKVRPLETVSKIVFVESEEVPSQCMISLFSQETKEPLEYKVKLAL